MPPALALRPAEEDVARRLHQALATASDNHDFEADYGGALTIEFEDPPAKFVVSPNSPVRQVWISAHSRSFKLDWSDSAFVLKSTGETLNQLVGRLVGEQLGIPPVIL